MPLYRIILYSRFVQEIMKVKGFQVAPAELEGCLLDHSDVDNACVVGIPDDYSTYPTPFGGAGHYLHQTGGEIPLAFIVLTSEASIRAAKDKNTAEEIKASIIKVNEYVYTYSCNNSLYFLACRRQQGSLQASCWRRGIHHINTHFPKWKVAPSRITRSGKEFEKIQSKALTYCITIDESRTKRILDDAPTRDLVYRVTCDALVLALNLYLMALFIASIVPCSLSQSQYAFYTLQRFSSQASSLK